MLRRPRFATAIAVLFLATPLVSALAAQAAPQHDSVAQSTPASNDQAVIVGATNAPAAFADRASSRAVIVPAGVTQSRTGVATLDNAAATRAARAASEASHNPAMMIVGGAALIVGAVVGGKAGTIVMIGGGILGLVGLWNYLQ